MKTNLHRLLPALSVMLLAACQELPIEASYDEYEMEELGIMFDPEELIVEWPFELYAPEVPGTFDFEDGTTQGWTLLQLYGSSGGPTNANRVPGWYAGPPAIPFYTPFALSNPQGISLRADAPSVVITDPSATSVDIYFQSPDLSGTPDWQSVQGFELDVMRSYQTPCGDPPNSHWAQLQVVVIDNATQQQRVFAEFPWRFHRIDHYTNYRVDLQHDAFSDSRYTVQHLRIRFTMIGYTSELECVPRNAWYIGNVTPVL